MSQTDPKQQPSKPTGAVSTSATGHSSQKAGGKNKTPAGSINRWYGVVFLLVGAIVGAYWFTARVEERPPVASAASEVELARAPENESVSDAAALVVDSNVRGADVYLNGSRVGKTPHKATPLAPGDYTITVSHPGYGTFKEQVRVETPEDSVHADLQPDGSESSTRVDAETSVGAEETEPAPGTTDIRGSGESIAVKHKHRIGSCEGALRASADGVSFETNHKDAFFVAYSDIEQLAIDKDRLTLKVRDGKKYDFNAQDDDQEALTAFYGRAGDAVAEASSEN